MAQDDARRKTGVSGQRSGQDRRQRDGGSSHGAERRGRQDRRERWSPFNEWSSPLKRSSHATGEARGSS
ncbi:hypothetical protein [Desulfoluna spongiiphila]|uniref:Uncharacterized protein n=1 Tax=Desulfoluna spongiiphila TaxID=419481 RepID=A0A1G5BRS4_9BACT|nr:hypothetical protein [Desulfoluna spongiiphila]SCX92925.1 hypothetical protein SAMN05216233_102162 [Desulfoluna spongiiphila]